MKKLSFVAVLLAGVAFTACGDKDKGDGTKDPSGNPPPVTITNNVSGAVKAGVSDAVEITGEGFDSDEDYVYAGYADGGETKYERISPQVLTIRSGRISFGLPVSATFLDKTVKFYLDRPGYDKLAISGDVTFTMPTVAEGYIPDPGLRATLSSDHDQNGNPNIAPLFNAYGMLDVNAAALIKTSGVENYGLNLYACPAKSLEGLELFPGIEGAVAAWDMPNVEEIDLSKWQAKGIGFHCERAANLTKLVGAPWARTIICHSCPKLTHVDVHNSNWLTRLEVSEAKANADVTAVTYLDIRRNHSGTYADSPQAENEFTIWGGDSFFKVAENATVMVDSWFLFDHNVASGSIPSCWANLHDAWKTRNAKIEVYSRVDPNRDQLLGTAPMSSVDPEALSASNKKGTLMPANKWQIDDPHTTDNEAPDKVQ